MDGGLLQKLKPVAGDLLCDIDRALVNDVLIYTG